MPRVRAHEPGPNEGIPGYWPGSQSDPDGQAMRLVRGTRDASAGHRPSASAKQRVGVSFFRSLAEAIILMRLPGIVLGGCTAWFDNQVFRISAPWTGIGPIRGEALCIALQAKAIVALFIASWRK